MIESFALRSGSSGNCIYVGKDGRGIIVDAGINGKNFAAALSEHGTSPEQIDGIVITHEHIDHISGLGVILRRHKIPLYISEDTLAGALPRIGAFDPDLIVPIRAGVPFEIGEFSLTGVPVPHDAADPMAYKIDAGQTAVSVCTDIGVLDRSVLDALSGSRLVYLEANYDEFMLANGPYPQVLKTRIRGRYGHLSNEACAEALIEFVRRGTTEIVLAHLSLDNNLPQIALRTVREFLALIGAREADDYRLSAAQRYVCSPCCRI
ncbi:MAG TPA: MBL fold metallo-hydrolase [Clostridiaceae bacterium]|nr:MBL fold metallo-hydrolase [Clostridiaceae bacterium]